jgi:hypothetical protein
MYECSEHRHTFWVPAETGNLSNSEARLQVPMGLATNLGCKSWVTAPVLHGMNDTQEDKVHEKYHDMTATNALLKPKVDIPLLNEVVTEILRHHGRRPCDGGYRRIVWLVHRF